MFKNNKPTAWQKNKKIEVKGREITIFRSEKDDYNSLTDIARYKDATNMDTIFQNWLRNRNTIELLGYWERLYNVNFNPLEFEGVRKQAGINSFVLTPKRWIETTNAEARGNMRDDAMREKLVVLSNL